MAETRKIAWRPNGQAFLEPIREWRHGIVPDLSLSALAVASLGSFMTDESELTFHTPTRVGDEMRRALDELWAHGLLTTEILPGGGVTYRPRVAADLRALAMGFRQKVSMKDWPRFPICEEHAKFWLLRGLKTHCKEFAFGHGVTDRHWKWIPGNDRSGHGLDGLEGPERNPASIHRLFFLISNDWQPNAYDLEFAWARGFRPEHIHD